MKNFTPFKMEDTQPSLILQNLGKSYLLPSGFGQSKAHEALKDLNVTIMKGQRWGIIGSNGSGKSTLLSILAGVIKPTKGKILRYGTVASILDIGSNFIPELSGLDNIYLYLNLNLTDKKKLESKIKACVDFAEIGDFIDKPVKTYSSGMFLRLAFSVSILTDADILLMDEVFGTGDAAFQDKVKLFFAQRLDAQITLLLASHNAEEITEYCDHCMWIEKGVLIQAGKVKDVIQAYYYKLAQKHSIESNKRMEVEHKMVVPLNKAMYSCDYFNLTDFRTTSIGNETEPTYQSGLCFVVEILKKTTSTTLYPQIVVCDYQRRPVLTLIPPLDSEINNQLTNLENFVGKVKFEVELPAQLLMYGHYYATLRFGKNASIENEYNEEAGRIEEMLFFEIKRSPHLEYKTRTEDIFVRPNSRWQIVPFHSKSEV